MADQLSCSCTSFPFEHELDYASVPVYLAQQAAIQFENTEVTTRRPATHSEGHNLAEDQLPQAVRRDDYPRHNPGLLDASHLGASHLWPTAPQSYPGLHFTTQ